MGGNLELQDKHYIIGIDLGTTNSALAYVDLKAETQPPKIKLFKIPQLTGPGEFARRSVLPSFLYIPGTYDMTREAFAHPWPKSEDYFAGVLARDQGAKVPDRLVASAKSWLCHPNVDHLARLLPWGSDDEVYKVSPVQATAAYLEHIKKAWNGLQKDEDGQFLENQIVIITVPASFDEVARDLTLKAANLAGLTDVILLEEPLAAFYSWLIKHEKNWSDFVQPNELILICDVGGGTTDFTLISLQAVAGGSPRFERIAVGNHLILGGDNIDIALARHVEAGLNRRQPLGPNRWKALCHQCRQAKEVILDGQADTHKITLVGEGSKLIAGTISADLDRAAVERIVTEQFFPLVAPDAPPLQSEPGDTAQGGLPYEAQSAVTQHIGRFLEQHRQDVQTFLNRDEPQPDFILFNGGSLKSDLVQENIRASIRKWFGQPDAQMPRILPNPEPDLAVALGAAYYGLVKTGRGVRVGSGSPRSYYLGIEQDQGRDEARAICLVERGLDEGTSIELEERDFEVLTNQPVSFQLFSSSFRTGDRSGDVVAVDDTFSSLPPIQTVVQFGRKGTQSRLPVHVEAQYTEMGTLGLWCRSLASTHRWQLQFQLRKMPAAGAPVMEQAVFDDAVLDAVKRTVHKAFDSLDKDDLTGLTKTIARQVEMPKEKWPLGFVRQLADLLIELRAVRKRSALHESRWMNLTGYCMRPGFGDGFDAQRLRQIWKLHAQGPVHAKQAQVRSEWWTLWRRLAGGLNPGQQRQFSQEAGLLLQPKKGDKAKLPAQEQLEIWMALANMERLYVKDKIRWGRYFLQQIKPKKCKPQQLLSLARLGARELLYGPVDRVIGPDEAQKWLDTLMTAGWRNPKPVGLALAQLARKTGDRIRDVDPATAEKALAWLQGNDLEAPYGKFITEVIQVERQEEDARFGEALPSGIVLKSET